MDVYWATVKWSWAEAASAVVASASGLVTTITVVTPIVIAGVVILAVAMVAGYLLHTTGRVGIVMNDSDAAYQQSEQNNGDGDS